MHRAQFLVPQERYQECEEILGCWSASGSPPSTLERRVAVYKDTALAYVRIAQKKHEVAMIELEKIVKNVEPVGRDNIRKKDLNWATWLLATEYCFKGGEDPNNSSYFQDVIDLLQPRIDELLDSQSQREFITSDFRLLVCEAQMKLGKLDLAQELLEALQKDLLLPSKVRNPRRHDQLFVTKQTMARIAHRKADWDDAVNKWYDALGHVAAEGINDETIRANSFKRSYDVDIAIFSLGVAMLHIPAKKHIGKQYIGIAEGENNSLTVLPKERVDYTHWSAYIREEHKRLTQWRMPWFSSSGKQ
jgi:hypothetical protein